jgi:Tfp pilus assembly protein FimT
MVFAMAIAVLLIAMTSLAIRPTIEQEGPTGLAYTLAADLRAARAEAMRSGHRVAFCFASDGGQNSLSRSAHIRQGEQRGEIWRSVSYDSEYDATIFLGTWGNAERKSYDIPPAWKASTARELALFFAPDGRAYSEDLPELEGRYAVVVASAMEGRFNGAAGVLRAARHPQTVWINRSGAVEVEPNQTPAGALPQGGSGGDDLEVAELSPDHRASGSAPALLSASFLPQQIEGVDSSGIGQNFVCIHPNQREGQQLEYGLATIEVRAEDQDGGPLSYTLEAQASDGEAGKFSIVGQQGEMSYLYDDKRHRYLWKAVASWRPPPAAPADLTYQLSMTISDPEGNSVVASTQAGLLPAVTNLPAARIVMETSGGRLYLTNLDGANEILISRNGAEYDPFFSRDGSSIFSFHDLDDGSHGLRGRPANGSTAYVDLASFHGSASTVFFDPTLTFAAILTPGGDMSYPWGKVTEVDDGSGTPTYVYTEGTESVDTTHLAIINLMSTDPPISVTERGDGTFYWAANARHTFHFGEEEPTPQVTQFGYGPFHVFPGHHPRSRTSSLVGFPPQPVPSSVSVETAVGRIYNPADQDWYLQVQGNELLVRNQVSGTSAVVETASGFESDTSDLRRNPSWSAGGEYVAFITSPGPAAHVVAKQVLDSSLELRSSFPTTIDLDAAGASTAQLSPEGRWLYFQRNNSVYRAVNSSGGRVVNVTRHLDADIADYVISP